MILGRDQSIKIDSELGQTLQSQSREETLAVLARIFVAEGEAYMFASEGEASHQFFVMGEVPSIEQMMEAQRRHQEIHLTYRYERDEMMKNIEVVGIPKWIVNDPKEETVFYIFLERYLDDVLITYDSTYRLISLEPATKKDWNNLLRHIHPQE